VRVTTFVTRLGVRTTASAHARNAHRVCHSHARKQADETLAKFLDFCTYGHMIDNVVLIVTGALHERDVQVRETGGGRSCAGVDRRPRPECTHSRALLCVSLVCGTPARF
jgi:hypothetical protein